MENGEWKPAEQSNDEILLMENFDFSENQITFNLENIIEIEQINKSFEWEFDAQKIRFPLRLRKQKDGDEFFPAGFSGKKKVSKFFRDEKISILARQKIWLLTDREDSVLGIIPFRQDRNFMATKDTKKTLKIR
jgi:tRNA(Ile)-lysidine synthase